MKTNNYNIYIQNIRGIAIICVVLIHCLLYTNSYSLNNVVNIEIRTLINFAVPVFYFISGYFSNIKISKTEKPLQYYKNRIPRILIPFIIWSTIYSILLIVLNGKSIDMIYILKWLLGFNMRSLFFLFALMQLIILTPFLCKIHNKIIHLAVLSVSFLASILLVIATLQTKQLTVFLYYTFIPWLSYYYFGIIIHKYKFHHLNHHTIIFILCFSILVITLINQLEYFMLNNIDYAIDEAKTSNVIYSFIIIVLISFCIKNNKANIFNKKSILTQFGNYSFGIYLIQGIGVLLTDKQLISYFDIQLPLQSLSCIRFILVLILSFIIIKTFNKFIPYKISRYLGLN